MADFRERIVIEAVDRTQRGFESARRGVDGLKSSIKGVTAQLVGFFAVEQFINLTKNIVKSSDTMVDLTSKLKLVTNSTKDYVDAQAALVEMSKESGSQLDANATLFIRLNQAIIANGGAQADTLTITKAVANGLRISGASAGEAASVVRQLSQALQSGVLRGDEYNSITENGGRITKALSDSLGVTIGELRAMAEQGKLTSDIVIKSLIGQSQTLSDEARSLPLTISRSIENMKTHFLVILSEFNEENGKFASGLNTIAQNFTEMIALAVSFVQILGVFLALKLATSIKNQTIAMQLQRAERARQIEDTATLERANRALDITQRRTAVAEAGAARTRAENAVLETRSTHARLTQLNEVLAVKIRDLKLEQTRLGIAIQVERDTARRILLEQQLTGVITARQFAEARQLGLSSRLENANTAQARAGVELRSSWDAQTAARGDLNNAMSRGNTVVARSTSLIKRLGAGIFGLPALIAFAAVEVASHFFDIEIALRSLQAQFLKLGVIIANPIDAIFGGDDFNKKLQKITDDIDEKLGITLEKKKKVSDGFMIEENKVLDNFMAAKKAIEIANERLNVQENKIATARTELFEKQKIEIDSILKLKQDSLDKEQANIEDAFDILVHNANATIEVEKDLSRKIEIINDQKEIALNNSRLQGVKDSIAFLRGKYDAEIALEEGNTERAIALVDERNKKVNEINKVFLKESRKGISLFQGQLDDVLNRIKSRTAGIQDLVKRSSEFIKSQTTSNEEDYEKAANAEKERISILSKVREAEKLNQIDSAAEVKQVQDEAIQALEDLITSERTRADSLEKDSLDELEAKRNINLATKDYEKLIKSTIRTQSNLNEADIKQSETIKATITERQKSLAEYQKEIILLDKSLLLNREIVITANIDEAKKSIDEIKQRLASIGAEVTLRNDNMNRQIQGLPQSAKPIVLSEPDAPSRFNTGGRVGEAYGGGDKVPALLEQGEFVIRKEVVREKGLGFFKGLNSGKILGLRTGGSVGAVNRLRDKYTSQKQAYASSRQDPALSNRMTLILDNILGSLDSLTGKSRRDIAKVDSINGSILSHGRRLDFKSSALVNALVSKRDTMIKGLADEKVDEPVVTTSTSVTAPRLDPDKIISDLTNSIDLGGLSSNITNTTTNNTTEGSSDTTGEIITIQLKTDDNETSGIFDRNDSSNLISELKLSQTGRT